MQPYKWKEITLKYYVHNISKGMPDSASVCSVPEGSDSLLYAHSQPVFQFIMEEKDKLFESIHPNPIQSQAITIISVFTFSPISCYFLYSNGL